MKGMIALLADTSRQKRFSRPPKYSVSFSLFGWMDGCRQAGSVGREHTVNDGTNDLVNLSNLSSLGGILPQRRKAIRSERLESGASDGGGRTSKSSPPEGPGETTEKLAGNRTQKREKRYKKEKKRHTS